MTFNDDITRCLHPPRHERDWQALTQLYEAIFPEWEREPSPLLKALWNNGERDITLLSQGDKISGFCIVDTPAEKDYALLSYLGVEAASRGFGFGSVLVRDALTHFKAKTDRTLMLIEAEDRQAKLYSRLGFTTLAVPYSVPKYNSDDAQPMNLQVFLNDDPERPLNKDLLADCLYHMFTQGYGLKADDPRLLYQMRALKNTSQLFKERAK